MENLSNVDFIKVVQRVVDEKAKLEDLFIDQLFERFERVVANIKTYKEKIKMPLYQIDQIIDSKRRYHCAIGNVLNEAYEVLKYHNR